MVSVSWPRWIAGRLQKKFNRRRRTERVSAPPSLELLEKRDLLSTANISLVGQPTERATPASDVAPIFGPQSGGYTPSQIRQAYGFNQINFNNGTVKGDGSGQTIAIVDAYNDPNLTNDLYQFDAHFGLANPNLSVVNQTGGMILPESDPSGEWAVEESLDVEWAHAIAPGANIVLVEASTDNITDMLTSAHTAAGLPGVSVVSMSWGVNEFATESGYDSYFTTPAGHTGVAFVAASGDNGAPPIYPAVSPNVLAVGGTTLTLNAQGSYESEKAWSGSGGGISAYETQPNYQKGFSPSASQRTNPDVAYNADPQTGFAVYDSYGVSGETGPWFNIGGTSAGAPQWAALIAIADQGRAYTGQSALDGPSQTMPLIYQMPASNFHDITTGSSTGTPSYSASLGYDLVTGRGTPNANLVVNYLVNGSSPPPSLSPSPSPSPPPPNSNLIQNGGFQQPNVGGGQVLDPSGWPWNFYGQAGIAGIGSNLTSGNPALGGFQLAFLIGQGSGIYQMVNLAAGTYTLSFLSSQVGLFSGSLEQIAVLVNGTVVGIITPGPNPTTYTITFPIYSAGPYSLQFLGITPGSNNGAFLDGVFLQDTTSSEAPPPSPSPSPNPSPSDGPPSSSPDSSPSSAGTGGPAPPSGGQLTQDDMNTYLQTILASLSNLLLNEMMLIQSELNQLLQLGSEMTGIPFNPYPTGSQQQTVVGLSMNEWEWLDYLLTQRAN